MRKGDASWICREGVSTEGSEGSLSFWLCDTPAITTKEFSWGLPLAMGGREHMS